MSELDPRQHGSPDQSITGSTQVIEQQRQIENLRQVKISDLVRSSQNGYSLHQELATKGKSFSLFLELPGIIDISFTTTTFPTCRKRSITLAVPREEGLTHDLVYIVAGTEQYKGYFSQYWELDTRRGFPQFPQGSNFILTPPPSFFSQMSFGFEKLVLPKDLTPSPIKGI